MGKEITIEVSINKRTGAPVVVFWVTTMADTMKTWAVVTSYPVHTLGM